MIKRDGKNYRELRCVKCRRLLALEYVFAGRVSIKCPKCGEINTINFQTPENLLNKLVKEDLKENPGGDIFKRKGVIGNG